MPDATASLSNVRAVFFDLDGVFYVGDALVPGGNETIASLRDRGLTLRFVTNTTRVSREGLHRRLRSLGLSIEPHEVLSALSAGVLHVSARSGDRVRLVVADDVQSEFAGAIVATPRSPADVVVIGDIGGSWTYDLINELFRTVLDGAEVVALHKGRYWQEPDGPRIDIGAFVAALEYATGTRALVLGKPSEDFFRLALADAGVEATEAVMVGDDVVSDVGGAQAAGMRGVLVRTGKFRPGDATEACVTPDAVVKSVASIPSLLA